MYLFHLVLLLLMYGTSRGFCNESAFVFVSPLVVSVDTWKKTYTKLVICHLLLVHSVVVCLKVVAICL